jgi:AmmeMemoRadiSam system protein A
LTGRKFPIPQDLPQVFNQLCASFVTLELGGHLRGCIGSIAAHRPLLSDLIANARSSAFNDPRFPMLTGEEFEKVQLKVSLLSRSQPIEFSGERELLDALVPHVDGLIISDGVFQAVYLPCVWDQLPDRKEFLESLKIKAGLPRNYFSDSLKAFRFSSESVP